MNKLFFLLGFIIFVNDVSAQETKAITVFSESITETKIGIYAKNTSEFVYSVKLEFSKLQGYVASAALPAIKVVEPKAEKQLLITLTTSKDKKGVYQFVYYSLLGNINARQNPNYQYWLPFEHGSTFLVYQTNFGDFSHQGQYAVDFVMPEGTKICAAREGIVIAVKQDSDKGGPTKDFADFGNHVDILHEDGTIAKYFHLQQNGSLVELGQKVEKGQPIALSGNTGWSSGPHLHFEVMKPSFDDKKTIMVKFLVAPDKLESTLKAKEKYTAYHPK